MIRPPALLPLVLLAGCGGGHHDDSDPICTLSPYATLTFSDAQGFNGSTEPYHPYVRSVLTDGTLVLDDPYGEVGRDMRSRLRVEIDYDGKKGKAYGLGDGASLRIHDYGDGTVDRVWEARDGRLVDEGASCYRHFRLEKATLSPVEGTGAVGTATLEGGIDSAIFG